MQVGVSHFVLLVDDGRLVQGNLSFEKDRLESWQKDIVYTEHGGITASSAELSRDGVDENS